MGNFYIRVIRDGERERTWGCNSRGRNKNNLENYIKDLINRAEEFHNDPVGYDDTPIGRIYKLELVKNRFGEKDMYREVEFELVMPNDNEYSLAQIIRRKDITHPRECYDGTFEWKIHTKLTEEQF